MVTTECDIPAESMLVIQLLMLWNASVASTLFSVISAI